MAAEHSHVWSGPVPSTPPGPAGPADPAGLPVASPPPQAQPGGTHWRTLAPAHDSNQPSNPLVDAFIAANDLGSRLMLSDNCFVFLFVRSGPGGYRALQSHATGSGTATADRQVWAAKVLVNAPANPDFELYATHTALWSELNNNPLFHSENLQQIQDAAVAARPSTPAGRRPGMVVRSITWWQHGVGLDMQGAVTAGAPRELCLLIERSLPLGVVPNIQHQQFSVFFFQKISLRAAVQR